MNFHNLHCEVPGGIGKQTIYDKSIIPWRIENVHLVFDGWLGGEILSVSSAIIVTDEMSKSLSFNYSGILSYESCFVEKSDTFNTVHPNMNLPNFRRMIIGNNAFSDDFSLIKYGDYYNQLIISQRAKEMLEEFNLGNFSIELVKKQTNLIRNSN